jgi:predicted branched-subunit amino acid permease
VDLRCKWGSGLNKQATSGPVGQRIWQHPEFAQGARDMLPVAPGIAAWGLMTGVAMMKSGLSLVESLAMALTVFAGSSQLASMPLIVAGAPIWVVLATGLCVNLRFVVFSIHLRPYVMHQPLWRRLVSGYLTADLSYVMFVKRFPHPVPKDNAIALRGQEAYLAGNCFVNWVSWVGASLLGIALANLIPPHWGLGFAGILALVGVASSLASSKLRMVSAAVAGAAAVAAFALPLKLNILVAICVAVVVCLSLEKLRPALPGTMQPPAPGTQPKGKT